MTTKGSDNVFPKLILEEVDETAVAAAATGTRKLVVNDSGELFLIDNGGTETPVGADISAHTGDTTDAHDASAISAVTVGFANSSGDDVQEVLGDFDAAISAAGGGGGALYPFDTNYFAETKPGSAASQDDEFDDDTGMSGTGNGLNGRWAWRNQGSATATYGKAGWLTMGLPAQNANGWRIIEQTLVDGTFDCKISPEYARANAIGMGLVLVDGTNGDFYFWGRSYDTGTSNTTLLLQIWNSVTSWNTNVQVTTTSDDAAQGPLFLRIVRAGTALQFWSSTDGIGWIRATTATDSVGATKIGLAINETNNTGLTKMHVDYFRKVA